MTLSKASDHYYDLHKKLGSCNAVKQDIERELKLPKWKSLDLSAEDKTCYNLKKQVLDLINQGVFHDDKIKIEKADIFSRRGQAETFHKENPFYYDEAGLFWMWDAREKKYARNDEVALLNSINDKLNIDTISSRSKVEIVNALRQVGRLHKPKTIPKHCIQFKSKIVDVKTGEEFDATHEFFATNPIPWELGDSEDTPTIDKYFREWVFKEGVQEESYVQTLYEIIAFASTNDQFMQRLIALCGLGLNGKGTYLKILSKFIGDDNICTSELKQLVNNNFETSALYKKLVCIMGEVDAYDLQNTNLLKKLSGEDKIRYEFKGKTPFSEESGTTCIMATNSLPVTPDHSLGFYRRWLVVDFPNQFKVGKDVLGDIPDQEFKNLARKVIRILKGMYQCPAFTNEGDMPTRIKKYEERSNPIMRFIEDCCVENPEGHTTLKYFSAVFNRYLQEHRLRTMTIRAISTALRKEGFDVKGKRIITKKGTPEQDERQTTCVFGLILKANAYSNLSKLSEIQSQFPIECEFKIQSVPVSSDKQTDNLTIDFSKTGIKEVLENE